MACNYNIKVVEGNEFALLFPLKKRTYVASVPIDEDIVYADLQDCVVKIGGVEYAHTIEENGVQVVVPATLAKGTYDIVLTATYHGSEIRAAYYDGLTIVAYNQQSSAQQYIAGSPIVAEAAFVIGGTLTDAELEALKEEYREKNAQLQQAIEDAEAAKAEWEQKAADLDGVAKESTSQDILNAVENIDIDTSDLAKQGTNPNATLSEVQTAAEAAQAMVQQIINAHVISSVYMRGWLFNISNASPGSALLNRDSVIRIEDNDITNAYGGFSISFPYAEYIAFNALQDINLLPINNCSRLVEYHAPVLTRLYTDTFLYNCAELRLVDIPNAYIFGNNGNQFANSLKLIDVIIGKNFIGNVGCLKFWSPTLALDSTVSSLLTPEDISAGFTSNLEKLLYNIREHIAANLPDRTGLSSFTVTFSAAVKAAILADQATADAFTNKGWTIA